MMSGGSSSSKKIDFTSANKKDVLDVTNKKYCMATTRKGRLLREGKPYDHSCKNEKKEDVKPHQRSIWHVGDEVKKIRVEYHMTQTLLDWGIEPVRPIWPEQDKGTIALDED